MGFLSKMFKGGRMLDPIGSAVVQKIDDKYVHRIPNENTHNIRQALKGQVKPAAGAGAAGDPGPQDPFNPFAQFSYTPGIGYGTGAGGQNPFAGVMQSIPLSFYQNPQALMAMMQMMGYGGGMPGNAPSGMPGPEQKGPHNLTKPLWNTPPTVPSADMVAPGPSVQPQTRMGRVGGFGNGGGSMSLGRGKWNRAL